MELSVILPVYNSEKTLPHTLTSLLDQKCDFSWEIVAVDDGSRDESLSVLQKYEEAANEKGISFRILSFENKGVGVNRNRGLDAACGDVILFLDADDLLLPDALSLAMAKKKEVGAAILLFDSEILYPDGTVSPFPMANADEGFLSVTDYMLSHPCPWNKLVDREIFTKQHFRFEEGILYEDLALIPALARDLTGTIYYYKKTLHRYFQSEGSIMRSSPAEKRLDLFPALEALYRNAKPYRVETEYLFFLHLYRDAVWTFWESGNRSAILRAKDLMKRYFPHWRKNPLIRTRFSRAERFAALLFYLPSFFLLKLWKGSGK